MEAFFKKLMEVTRKRDALLKRANEWLNEYSNYDSDDEDFHENHLNAASYIIADAIDLLKDPKSKTPQEPSEVGNIDIVRLSEEEL